MLSDKPSYWSATRHPWNSLLFLLPLLAAYEGGILWLGGTNPEALRNGVDTWLHWALTAFGLKQLYYVPGLIVVLLLGWSWWRRKDRPGELLATGAGMAIESIAFALGLWMLSRLLGPLLDRFGIQLTAISPADEAVAPIITFVGAGIYEEVLFRLLLFPILLFVLKRFGLPTLAAVSVAAVGSATIFAAAHNLGTYGEPFEAYAFLFRTLAGLYFTLLFQFRGFGIAVGTHACYDVLVGAMVG